MMPAAAERLPRVGFVRIGEQGGVSQPPGVPQIQRRIERLQRVLADRLEKGVGLQHVRRRVQRAGCLTRKWFLHKRREDTPPEAHCG